jgi:hypothetical protein
VTTPFPGSQMFDDAVNDGTLDLEKLKLDDWERFTTFNPDPEKMVTVCKHMTSEELLELQRKANYSFYSRPKMVFRQLFKIRTVGFKDLMHGVSAITSKS